MALTKKQLRAAQAAWPGKEVPQISRELGVPAAAVYRALGLQGALRDHRLATIGTWVCAIALGAAPLVFIRGLRNFADLPQRCFVQMAVILLALLVAGRAACVPRRTFPVAGVHAVAAAFVLWLGISLAITPNGYEGLYAGAHWAACAGLLFLLPGVLGTRQLDRIVWALCLGAGGVVLLGLAQQFFQFSWVPQRHAPSAAFANPNMLAQYLAMIVPVVCAVALTTRRVWVRCLCGATVAGALVLIFFTGCRAAWVALGTAMLWVGALALARRRCISALILIITVCACIGAGAFLLRDTTGPPGFIRKSAGYRLILMRNTLAMIAERPVIGFGPAGFQLRYPLYKYARAIDPAFDKEKQVRRAHNDFLQVGAELGVPGMVLFAALPILGLFMAWRVRCGAQDFRTRCLAGGLSGGIVCFMGTACFSFPFQRSVPPMLLMVFLALLFLLYRQVCPQRVRRVRIALPRKAWVVLAALVLAAGVVHAHVCRSVLMSDKYFFTAMQMEKRGLNRRARAAGREALRWNPYRMDARTTVGRALVTTGDLDAGIAELENVVRHHPCNMNALFILGAACANSGRTDRALEVFTRVLQIKPDFPEARKIVALLKSRGEVTVNLR